MTFKFDTSGVIYVPSHHGGTVRFGWGGLTPFEQGYVEAMFAEWWSGLEKDRLLLSKANVVGTNDHVAGLQRIQGACRFSDLAPETLARIREDCGRYKMERLQAREDGARFWAVRNDSTGCEGFPPLTPYLGDDGKVYLREGA
jgi:hypothetical protein